MANINELSEKEQKVYEIKLKNMYYYSNLFENKDISNKEINTLEKRNSIHKYLFNKISFLKNEIIFLENSIEEIKNELIKKFGSYELSNEEVDKLNKDIETLIPVFDEDLSKKQNEIVFETQCYSIENEIYRKIQIAEKDDYEKGIIVLNDFNSLIRKHKLNIEFLTEELLKFKPIEMKNGFYLFENIEDHFLLSGNSKKEDIEITDYNSVFIGPNKIDQILEESGNSFFNTKNLNSVANVIPELEYDNTLEQKTFIALNGMGGRKGGLFEKEIIASCKEEALLKLNKWAKENKSYSWSIYHMTKACSSGFVNIYEKKDNVIK